MREKSTDIQYKMSALSFSDILFFALAFGVTNISTITSSFRQNINNMFKLVFSLK